MLAGALIVGVASILAPVVGAIAKTLLSRTRWYRSQLARQRPG